MTDDPKPIADLATKFLGDVDRLFADPKWQARAAAEERDRSTRERRDTTTQRLRSSGIVLDPDDLAAIVAGKLEDTPSLNATRGWLGAPRRPILVLCGSVGVGKTLAGGWAIAARGGLFLRATEIGKRMEPYQHEKRDGVEILFPRSSGEVVVLDDLGLEDLSDRRTRDGLIRFVEERASRRDLRTLITSNLPRASFRERYDARFVERLNHYAVAVDVPGPSKRRAGDL